MAANIRARCRVGPRAAHDSGPRRARDIDLIVIHSAEGTSAIGVARFFAKASTRASTQLAADPDECRRMLPDLAIPWGAVGANHDGLHVELCGFARWTRSEWLEPRNRRMLERAAFKCARWAWQYGVPRRWLPRGELRAGRRGFTTHVDVNAAFKGGTHWDPGPGFPRDVFLELVKGYYREFAAERAAGRR